jgi:hypothetical protein
MAHEPDLGVGPIQVAPRDVGELHRAPCPRCGAASIPGVPACAACGHAPSIDPGIAITPSRAKARKSVGHCRGCGYSLAGLTGNACPECGKRFSTTSRRDWDEETSRDVTRRAYASAGALAAGGVLLGIFVHVAGAGWPAGAMFAGGWLVSAFIGVAVLLACGAMWVGFSSSVPLAALQVAAAHAVALVAGFFVLAAFGVAALAIVTGVGLYLVMMERFLDLDPFDARCVAGLCVAAHVLAAGAARVAGLI